MTKKEITQFPREIMHLFDDFVHGRIDRRGFLEKGANFAAFGISAAAYLKALEPDFASAQKISPDDERLSTFWVQIASPNGNGKIKAYVALPKKRTKKLGVVLVCHENRGLNPHIKDIARRIALEGFVAIAPDALTSLGGYPGNEDDARNAFQKLDIAKVNEDFVATFEYAKGIEGGNGKIGVIGFCWGGGMCNYLATRLHELKAAVPFYGPAPKFENVKNIKAALMFHFASDDNFVNVGWPDYEKALRENGIKYQAFTYENTLHGFNNDTTPRFNEIAAKLAFSRSIDFFHKNLDSGK